MLHKTMVIRSVSRLPFRLSARMKIRSGSEEISSLPPRRFSMCFRNLNTRVWNFVARQSLRIDRLESHENAERSAVKVRCIHSHSTVSATNHW